MLYYSEDRATYYQCTNNVRSFDLVYGTDVGWDPYDDHIPYDAHEITAEMFEGSPTVQDDFDPISTYVVVHHGDLAGIIATGDTGLWHFSSPGGEWIRTTPSRWVGAGARLYLATTGSEWVGPSLNPTSTTELTPGVYYHPRARAVAFVDDRNVYTRNLYYGGTGRTARADFDSTGFEPVADRLVAGV